jgi:hypothetical protein
LKFINGDFELKEPLDNMSVDPNGYSSASDDTDYRRRLKNEIILEILRIIGKSQQ